MRSIISLNKLEDKKEQKLFPFKGIEVGIQNVLEELYVYFFLGILTIKLDLIHAFWQPVKCSIRLIYLKEDDSRIQHLCQQLE